VMFRQISGDKAPIPQIPKTITKDIAIDWWFRLTLNCRRSHHPHSGLCSLACDNGTGATNDPTRVRIEPGRLADTPGASTEFYGARPDPASEADPERLP
jgi:hypothetical protein